MMVLLLWFFSVESAHPREGTPILLGVGEQKLFHTPGLKRFSLSGKAARAVRPPSPRQLLIKGVMEGPADLFLWFDGDEDSIVHRSIQVRKFRKNRILDQHRHLIRALDETEVLFLEDKVVLSGTISTKNELHRIDSLQAALGEQIINRTRPTPEILNGCRKDLEGLLPSDWHLSSTTQTIIIRGPSKLHDQEQKDRIRSVCPRVQFLPKKTNRKLATAYFRILLMELKKDEFLKFGLEWPDQLASAAVVTPQSIRTHLELDALLHQLSAEGKVQVLAHPQLAVRIPGKAELFAGGEFPIRIQSRFQNRVSWKPYGVLFKLETIESRYPHIKLNIHSEISRLDPSAGNDDLPGVKLNRIQSEVEAQFGRPLFLSGLLDSRTREQVQGIPILKEIPILGSLFSSREYHQEKTDLLAVLIPHEYASPQVGQDKIPLGPIPFPRNWNSDLDSKDPDFPWNALQ